MVGFLGVSQEMTSPGKPTREVWYQNAAFVWIPLMILIAVIAWMFLKSVPVTANIKQQFDIFKNQDTWWMTILYIMTFGTFSGLSAQFGLLMINLYGAGNPEIVSGSGAAAKAPGRPRRSSYLGMTCPTRSTTSSSAPWSEPVHESCSLR